MREEKKKRKINLFLSTHICLIMSCIIFCLFVAAVVTNKHFGVEAMMEQLINRIIETDEYNAYYYNKYDLYISLSGYLLTDIILLCILCQFTKRLICNEQEMDDNNNPKNTNIAKVLIKLTALYLVVVLLWSIIMTISRLSILFGFVYFEESCIVTPMYLILIIISKLNIFFLYLSRIQISFKNTAFAYKPRILYLISLFIAITFTFSYCFGILFCQYLFIKTNDEICMLSPKQLMISVFPMITFETCSWLIILYLFLFKLHQIIISTHLKEKDELMHITLKKNQLKHIENQLDPIISAMSRLSISILISLIGQIILYLSIFPFYPGLSFCIMIILNSLSAIYCFKHYRTCYQIYCYPCDYFCKSLLYKFVYSKKIIQHRNRAPTLS